MPFVNVICIKYYIIVIIDFHFPVIFPIISCGTKWYFVVLFIGFGWVDFLNFLSLFSNFFFPFVWLRFWWTKTIFLTYFSNQRSSYVFFYIVCKICSWLPQRNKKNIFWMKFCSWWGFILIFKFVFYYIIDLLRTFLHFILNLRNYFYDLKEGNNSDSFPFFVVDKIQECFTSLFQLA